MRYLPRTILFVIMSFLAFSCVPYNKLRYFNDIDKITEPTVNPREQKMIVPFDVLYIQVLSIDEQTNNLFNPGQGSSGVQFMVTYQVDEKGFIDFPFVGQVNISGLSLTQASSKIKTALSEYVSRTEVIVRYVGNSVTLLGQVQNQGTYTFSKDKLNIYEALALGGGISDYGNRKNVIVTRQEGDNIIRYKLNLTDSKIASKDSYYVLPNDIIIVEPIKSISWHNYNSNTYSTVLTSVTTLLALFVVFF